MSNQNQNNQYKPIRQRVDEGKAEDAKQKKLKFSEFKMDMKRNPMIFIGLIGSAFLTALSGLFIGLAPRIDALGNLSLFGGIAGWGAAIVGIFFGVLYMLTFPTIGEYGTYYWHRKAALRDPKSITQAIISYGMLAITFVFMVATAIAASYILASLLRTFTAFNAIPEWAQKWTVLIIPIALALHAGANMWYDHVSKYAEERRVMDRNLQTVEIEAENRVREARIKARENAAITFAEEYEEISRLDAATVGKDNARRAWKRDRVELGGDHDGDGIPNVADADYSHHPSPNGRDKETVNSPR